MASSAVIYQLIARDGASAVFNRVGRSADGMGSKMAKVAKVAAGVGVALVGLGAGAAEAADKAAEFQASMTRIQTQAGATAKDVATLSRAVLKLAPSTQQGPQQLSEALYHLKSVGMDNAKAMKALKTASDLAAVGGANLEDTTNALAGAWRTGIKGATSFSDAASTVNAIIGAGNMTMEDFTDALSSGILPTAKTFGLTMKQVGAALALFTDEGVPANSAATRLRMSISLLGAPSGAAEKQLKKIGLTGLDLANAMRGKNGIIGAIQMLKDHLDASGLSASQQSQILSKAFGGGKSSSAILSMVNNLDVLKQKQDQVNASTGKYADAVKTQRKTAEAQWKILSSNLETMTITLGTKLLPPITGFVKAINTKAIPAAGRLASTLAKLVPIDRIKADFATVSSMVGDFMAGLKGAKAPAVKLTPSSFLTKSSGPTLPPLAAPKVKPIPQNAFQVSGSAALPPLLPAKPSPSQAKQVGQQFNDILTAGLGSLNWSKLGSVVGAGLGKAFDWVVSHGSDLSKKIGKAIGGVDWVDVGKQFGNVALPLAIGIADNLFAPLFTLDFWKTHWLDTILAVISFIPIGKLGDGIGSLASKIPWGKLGDLIAKGWDKIPWGKIFSLGDKINWSSIFTIGGRINWSKVLTLGDIGPASIRWAAGVLARIRTGFSSNFPRLTQWLSDQWTLLPTRFGDLGRALNRKMSTAFTDLGEWIVQNVPGMGNKLVRGLIKAIGRYSMYQTGVNLIEGLYNGITAKIGQANAWVQNNIVNPFVGWVKKHLGIHSPSTVFAGIGGNIISGLKNGVVAGAKGLGTWAIAHMVSPVVSRFANARGWLTSKGSAIVVGLKDGALAGAKGIASWAFSHVAQPLTSRFSGAKSWLPGRGSQLISGLKNGVTGAIKGIGGWVKSHIVDPVVNAVKKYFGIHSPSTVFATLGGHLTAGLLKGMAQTGGASIAKTVFGSLPSALASIVGKGLVHITSLPGKALKALGGLGGKLGSLLGGIFGGGSSKGGVSQWAGDVQTVLAMLGAPSSALSAVLTRIGIESGGNPKAINLWDSNAKAGHPSQGLMQTIPGTFAAYAGPFKSRGITDPLASIYAGVNYAMHRYGKNWISVMTRPGGYAKGTGAGVAPIGQTAWVGERGPELMQVTPKGPRIYSNRQSMAMAGALGIRLPGYAAGTVATSQQRVADAQDNLTRAKRRRLGIQAAETRLAAAKRELANTKATTKTSVSNALANGFLKTVTTGTASAIASAVKSINSKLQNAGAGSLVSGNNRTAGKLETLATKKSSIVSQISAANQAAADQSSSLASFLDVSGTTATSVNSLAIQMEQQQSTARKFAAEMAALSKKGLDKTLLQQIAAQGPGGTLSALLAQANGSDVSQLNKLAKSQTSLTSSFGKTMADAMYDSGAQAGKGFLTGLQAQEKAIEAEMSKLGASLVKGIKKKLKIKSPSRVMRDEVGRQIGAGLVAGIDAHHPAVRAAAGRLAAAATSVRVRQASGGAVAQRAVLARVAEALERVGSLSDRPVAVHMHWNDPALHDLVDVRVDQGLDELGTALGVTA